MTTEKAIKMIDEYLTEPHSINKEWVECLTMCKEILIVVALMLKVKEVVGENNG